MKPTNSYKPAIVVVAFNRPTSIKRLLKSIANAHYPIQDINLVISIDFSDSKENKEVLKIAKDFQWNFGVKTVNYEPKNLGLRKHILKCGSLTQKFGSVIILEDDLFVSPNFYTYAAEALDFTNEKEYISGVSLYNHKTNVHIGEYFSALDDGYDNWYFQFASSWGQAWTQTQWSNFSSWYSENDGIIDPNGIPENVISWTDKSWLKYFIAYMIKKDKYFLYPKISLATNFNDQGTHVGMDSTTFQVELLQTNKIGYNFSELSESLAVYDAFFENKNLFEISGISGDGVVDLYGTKNIDGEKFILSSDIKEFEVKSSYSRSLKPIELNIINEIEGNDIFLYDLSKPCQNSNQINTDKKYRRIIYTTKYVSHPDSLIIHNKLFKVRAKNLIRKLFKK